MGTMVGIVKKTQVPSKGMLGTVIQDTVSRVQIYGQNSIKGIYWENYHSV